MQVTRGCKVKWPSRYNEKHWFHGTVKRVLKDRAIIGDGSGLTYRVVPIHLCEVTNDSKRIVLQQK